MKIQRGLICYCFKDKAQTINGCLLWQLTPVNPTGQTHVNPSSCKVQVPPFWHGITEHGSKPAGECDELLSNSVLLCMVVCIMKCIYCGFIAHYKCLSLEEGECDITLILTFNGWRSELSQFFSKKKLNWIIENCNSLPFAQYAYVGNTVKCTTVY